MYHVSLIDTDLYKLTMQQAICMMYPKARVRYDLIVRDGREFPEGFAKRLRSIVDSFRAIRLQNLDSDFLRERCYYLNPMYRDFLNGYKYEPSEVIIIQEGHKLAVGIEGYWFRTVLWEVPLMSTICELYYEMTGQRGDDPEKRHLNNRAKAEALANIGVYYSEFGTRRRYSYKQQCDVVDDLKNFGEGHMLGTSNVHLAMLNDLIPMGTVAHEWYQYHGAQFGYKMANKMAHDAWVQVYQGDLGTALSDTYTTDAFFQAFDTKYAKLFDGVRQDSGDPHTFIQKAVSHYEKLRINPQTKMALFSDNLNSTEKIKAIHGDCAGKLIDRYGIGTWLTCDCGVKPMNIVIKMTSCNSGSGWVPTVKLSDDPGKHTGLAEAIRACKESL
jgi:nicotinate phosphoribosyltransferase